MDESWWFAVVVGIFLTAATFVIWVEKKEKSNAILQAQPHLILLRIVAFQLTFYIFYANILQVATLELSQIRFWNSQMLNHEALDASFDSNRSIAGMFSMLAASVPTCLVVASFTPRSQDVLDYCVTLYFIHFWIVCVYSWGFPTSAVWWIVCGASLTISVVFGEYSGFKLDGLDYKSALGGGSR